MKTEEEKDRQYLTPEERHNYNRSHAIGGISYAAVGTIDAIVLLRDWMEKWLAIAYDAGYDNAKKGEL